MAQESAPKAGANGARNIEEQPVTAIQDTMSQFLGAATVEAVYGEPIHEGTTTVIPCAEVLSIAGFGLGYGTGTGDNQEGKPQGGTGGGGGGGGRVLSRPVAVIEITPSGVKVQPVIDATKLALAGITAWGFMIATMMRMSGRRRKPWKPE